MNKQISIVLAVAIAVVIALVLFLSAGLKTGRPLEVSTVEEFIFCEVEEDDRRGTKRTSGHLVQGERNFFMHYTVATDGRFPEQLIFLEEKESFGGLWTDVYPAPQEVKDALARQCLSFDLRGKAI